MSRPWLAVIDMQRVFAEPDSDWYTPRFHEIVAPIRKLLPGFGDHVIHTRFVAPPDPIGSWRAYYDQWPAELVAPDDRRYEIVEELTPEPDATVLTATTFGKWNAELAATIRTPGSPGQLALAGVATDCCVLSTAIAAADAGVHVRVVAQACAGLTDESHHKALDILSGYAPMIEVVELADIVDLN
jgi:nicotinamidase-related amidase